MRSTHIYRSMRQQGSEAPPTRGVSWPGTIPAVGVHISSFLLHFFWRVVVYGALKNTGMAQEPVVFHEKGSQYSRTQSSMGRTYLTRKRLSNIHRIQVREVLLEFRSSVSATWLENTVIKQKPTAARLQARSAIFAGGVLRYFQHTKNTFPCDSRKGRPNNA